MNFQTIVNSRNEELVLVNIFKRDIDEGEAIIMDCMEEDIISISVLKRNYKLQANDDLIEITDEVIDELIAIN